MSEKNFDAIWTAFYDHCLLVSDGNEAVASQMVADKLEDLLTPEQKAEIAQMSAVAEEAKIDTINSIKNDQEQIFKESI